MHQSDVQNTKIESLINYTCLGKEGPPVTLSQNTEKLRPQIHISNAENTSISSGIGYFCLPVKLL